MSSVSPLPMAVAVAVPMKVHSQEEAISLFANVPGVEVIVTSDNHDMEGTFNFLSKAFQQQSTMMNPFGIATATRGSFQINNTTEGEPTIATLFVASGDRFRGDMASAVVLPDNSVLAQWNRNQRPTMIQSGDTTMPLSVFGQPYGQMQTSSWGMGHTYVDASGSGVKVVSRGCFQPKMYMCCASFCCFFPTLGIGSCIILSMMAKAPAVFDLKRTPNGPIVASLKYWSTTSDLSVHSKMRLDFPEDTDAKTRLSATLASLFFLADAFVNPPSSNGGSGGAPDAATMER